MTVSRTLCDVGLPSSDARGLPPLTQIHDKLSNCLGLGLGRIKKNGLLELSTSPFFLIPPNSTHQIDDRIRPDQLTMTPKVELLPRDAMLARSMPSSCVCLSVCLSVTSQCSTETAERRITQTTQQDSSFLTTKISAKLKRGHSQQRRQMQAGYVKIGDFRQITRYNSKTSTVADMNLVRSQVYHTERPPLFAARLP